MTGREVADRLRAVLLPGTTPPGASPDDVTNAERRMPYPSESGTVRLYIEATRPSVSEPPAVGIDELPETSMDGT